jgi:uncharacterized protein (DUF1800 family)
MRSRFQHPSRRVAFWFGPFFVLVGGLAACGGEGAGTPAALATGSPEVRPLTSASARGDGATLAALPPAALDGAVRLAQQATFGPQEALIQDIRARGAAGWVKAQMALDVSRYSAGGDDRIHRNAGEVFFCDQPAYSGPNCWRDWFSSEPLSWDFYRNAVSQPDQLRQRVALALQQMLVISEVEVNGTYGFRNYYNRLLSSAFGNYRDLLKAVILSPMMGEYLDHVNNDPALPNENFARELLQLFSIGVCALDADGRPSGGGCRPNYDNTVVREYAYALTGWTYPDGGSTVWGCWPEGSNCPYMAGDMVPAAPVLRNGEARRLLSGIRVPAGATAAQALEQVLDSLMQHRSMAPFVCQHLIRQLVGSNPSPAYMRRCSQAFVSGSFSADGQEFGAGRKGDLAATVAAVLLDREARAERSARSTLGMLREPILLFTGALRAFNGRTDGAIHGWWWGQALQQHVFMPPSVFNFYPRDYPVAGTNGLVGPQFGIYNANTGLNRLNYLTAIFDWRCCDPDPNVPGAIGTQVNLDAFEALADDAAVLVDNISRIVAGRTLKPAPRGKVIAAVAYWTPQTDAERWRQRRAETAAYLVLASPDHQVQR